MSSSGIYLDYAATTPVDPAVRDAMVGCLSLDGEFANPSSDHHYGQAAKRIVEDARGIVAERLGARPEGIVFTSGATEANNLALFGTLPAAERPGSHLVTSAIEHHSVLDAARHLARDGVEVTFVECDARGRIAPDAVAAAITPATRLVSIMHVNNEVGTVQDIRTIAAACREHEVPLHVDAAQGAGKLPLPVDEWGITLCSVTAHKLCGPKGIGALYVRPGTRLEPMLHGGEQERRLRPGTQATHQIAGLGKAFELASDDAEIAAVAALRDRLWSGIARIEGAVRNGDPDGSAPHILSVSFPGIDGESLRFALDGVALSQGSACSSDTPEPSHVLTALGFSDARARSTLRFGVGRFTTAEEIDTVLTALGAAVGRLSGRAAGAPAWCSA